MCGEIGIIWSVVFILTQCRWVGTHCFWCKVCHHPCHRHPLTQNAIGVTASIRLAATAHARTLATDLFAPAPVTMTTAKGKSSLRDGWSDSARALCQGWRTEAGQECTEGANAQRHGFVSWRSRTGLARTNPTHKASEGKIGRGGSTTMAEWMMGDGQPSL